MTTVALAAALALITAGCNAGTTAPQPGPEVAGTIRADAVGSGTPSEPDRSVPSAEPAATPAASDPLAPSAATPQEPATAPAPPTAAAGPAGVPPGSPAVTGPVMAPAPPVSLRIPAIGVDSAVIDLGLNPDSTVQVPPLDDPDSKAGWYTGSPEPGTAGPAILLGHIDSRAFGPGVFYSLGALNPGDQVEIGRQDGSVAVFQVDGVRTYHKDLFPTLEVYGNIDHAGLRLITCGGVFDPDAGSYESNVVAFASLVGTR